MGTCDSGITPEDYLASKVLNAQSIAEAAALVRLARKNHPAIKTAYEHPLNWGIEVPLCQHCWQELSVDKGFCPLCRAISVHAKKSRTRVGTGVLVSCQDAKYLDFKYGDPVSISDSELLFLLPAFKVGAFLVSLRENPFPVINVVFPGNGDMAFGDALAIARYAAGKAHVTGNMHATKFYFSHAHMRAFDFDTFLGFDIVTRLFEMASVIKSVFSADDRHVLFGLLKKNKVNRTYELKRFYSMCDQYRKSVLEQIQIDRIAPQRGVLLLSLVKYVYRND